jgi:hypothetical protein
LPESATESQESDLYPRLMDSRWLELAEPVRRAHATGSGISMLGSFNVRRGRGVVARCLAWWLRLPAAQDAAPVKLSVLPRRGGEQWQRTFDGAGLATRQWHAGDGLLRERLGLLEVRFELVPRSGELVYRQVGARLNLGLFHLPLPPRCAPSISAREAPSEKGVHIWVTVSDPCAGLLLSYEGHVWRAEPEE